MKLTQLLAVGLAVLLVGAGAAAAVPSQADDNANNADDHADTASADDHADEAADAANETADNESADAAEDDSERAGPPADVGANAGPPADAGPPTDMPAQVPDHVAQIHERINQFLSGEIDDLGAAIGDLVGGDDESENADAAAA